MPANEGAKVLGPGSTIESGGDSFEILSELGRGGMGIVFKARQASMDRLVAIKMLNAMEMDSESLQRFSREAKAVAQLDHPNIVKVFSIDLAGRNPFIVMELVEGQTLSEIIKDNPEGLAMSLCYQIFDQMLAALSQIHATGFVHRDIKPSNIIVTEGGATKLMDFGIAKSLTGEDMQRVTRTGAMLGSPWYMSPEQCAAQDVDHRCDIYSLGCTMYEALSGKPPFTGETSLEVMFAHTHNDAPTLQKIDHALRNVIARAMEREPQARFQTAGEFREALAACREGRYEGPERKRRRRRSFISKRGALVALAVALLAMVAYFAFFPSRLANNEPVKEAPDISNPPLLMKRINAQLKLGHDTKEQITTWTDEINQGLEYSKRMRGSAGLADQAKLLQMLTALYDEQGNVKLALAAWKEYVATCNKALGLRERLKAYRGALTYLETQKLDDQFDALYSEAIELAHVNHFQTFEGDFLRLRALHEWHRNARHTLGAERIAQDALKKFQDANDNCSINQSTARTTLGQLYRERAKWRQLADLMTASVPLNDNRMPDADNNIGYVSQKIEQCRLACEAYANLADRKNFDKYAQLMLQTSKDFPLATAQTYKTDRLKLLIALAGSAFRKHDYKTAVAAAEEVNYTTEDPALRLCALNILGASQFDQKQYQACQSTLNDALPLRVQLTDLLPTEAMTSEFYLALSSSRLKDKQKAVQHFSNAQKIVDEHRNMVNIKSERQFSQTFATFKTKGAI